MARIKCKRSVYRKAKAGKLNVDATAVRQGMFVQHPLVFPIPPITEAILMALILTYIDAYSAYEKGGANQKGAYEAAKTALLNALDQLAEARTQRSTLSLPHEPTRICMQRLYTKQGRTFPSQLDACIVPCGLIVIPPCVNYRS